VIQFHIKFLVLFGDFHSGQLNLTMFLCLCNQRLEGFCFHSEN